MKLTVKMLSIVAVCAIPLAGCATRDEVVLLKQELNQETSEKEAALARVAELEGSKADAGSMGMGGNLDKISTLPPNARPGECYARVLVPEQYKTEMAKVLVSPEGTKVEASEAKYVWKEKQRLISEESVQYTVIPATYKTVTENVMFEPEKKVLAPVPAVYKSVTERIEIHPAHQAWKSGRGPIEKIDEATGEIMCLVTVPAEYKDITKQVMVSAASTKTTIIPAVYKKVTKQVVDHPATTQKNAIPAKYETIRISELVSPAESKTTKIPAKYDTVEKRVKVSESQLEWRPILCETNTTPDVVKRIQVALKGEGYNPGEIDGVYGNMTQNAVEKFQKNNELPSGQLTIETLKKLKVDVGV